VGEQRSGVGCHAHILAAGRGTRPGS
jgi:hypothetical protein